MNIQSPNVQGSMQNLKGKILRTRHDGLLKETYLPETIGVIHK